MDILEWNMASFLIVTGVYTILDCCTILYNRPQKNNRSQLHEIYQLTETLIPNLIIQCINVPVIYLCDNYYNYTDKVHYYYYFNYIPWILCSEMYFYYVHRLFHTPYLYKNIHYFHHKHDKPYALCAYVVHPLEHLLVNLPTLLIGPMIFHVGVSKQMMKIWVVVANISIISSHCGYFAWWGNVNNYHDIHHRLLKYNYGNSLYLFDKFHKTIKYVN